ncbi:nitrogen fixation protein NifR [Staphylococcus aureus]|nr:nitrogen fixation protein NifR [Staphylococcus aureus]
MTCKLAEIQHSEIGFLISKDDASWRGHKHRNWRYVSLLFHASWGNGPNIVKLDPQFLLTLQVGGAPT